MKRLLIFLITFFSIFLFLTADLRCAMYEASYVPWSGYWWPFSKGGLVNGAGYRGHPSPLSKYDYVTSGTYYGSAYSYGLDHYYDEDALSWEGMCFYWAAAAILEEEPVHKGIYEGTTFLVGDKKGLLTVAYDGVICDRYYFDGADGPELFHKVLEDCIRDQKTPVIMDLGSSEEKWNHPVFKYDMSSTEEGNKRHYTTTIYYVTDMVSPDYVGSSVLTRTYYYYFVLDGEGNITESGWEGSYHPKNASEPFAVGTGWVCRNTGIDYDELKKIVTTDDDPYENNDNYENAVLLSSGRYPLLAIDRDFFKVALESGDRLNIRMTAEEDGDISMKIYDPDFSLIQETSVNGEYVVEAVKTGNYTLDVLSLNPSEEPFYELTLQQKLSYQGIFPVDPLGSWYNGIALLNPDNDIGRTIISQMGRNGSPQMGKGYHATSSARHLLGLEESFGLYHSDKGYLRVDSDVPLRGLQAVHLGDYLLMGANLMSVDKASSDVFFPHFARTGGWKTSFGLINAGDQTEEILWQSYDQEGEFIASDTIELAPGEKVEYDTSYITAHFTSDTKNMSAAVTSGRNCLMGYTKFTNSSASKGQALVPLAMERNTELVAPHIALNINWGTDTAVMNTGNGNTTVTFSAYDAEGNLIGTSEHILKPKQNFVSVVSSIFPGVQAGEIASMNITSTNGQPLCGLLLYESTDELLLAGLPIRPVTASTVYLSHLACFEPWWTGIGVINAGDTPADITFSLFNGDGVFLSSRTRGLNPNQRLAIIIKSLFDDEVPPTARYMKIESSGGQPVSGIYVMGTNNLFRAMGDVIH